MAIKQYDPKKVAVIFAGLPLSGFAPGTFVKVEYNEDAFSLEVGADGETTRVKNANMSGKITVTLMASSASNDDLSDLAVADRVSGEGTFAGLIKDAKGTSNHAAATCWISKVPPAEYSKEGNGTREWVVETDELLSYVGGSTLKTA